MGMDYNIVANKETNCEDYFPEGLSNFLEQFPVSEYHSEVRQVSQILNINLDPFQVYDDGDPDVQEKKNYWQDIDTFAFLVDGFINKISENKDYYKKIRYNKNTDSLNEQLNELLHTKDENSLKNQLEQLYENKDLSFPPDRGYLSANRIVEENELKRILNCYKKAGATKIKLLHG